jgi:hypothetical protein
MPSRCTCDGEWNPGCKRHGEAVRARARVHKQVLWSSSERLEMARRQQEYRIRTGRTIHTEASPLRSTRRAEVMAGRPENWKEQAACRGKDPELFFVERGDDAGEAKRICRECPVRLQCLEYALTVKERYGIWGGLGEHERRRYAQRKAAS